ARSVRLDGALHLAASFEGLAVPDGDASACARVSNLALTGALAPCVPGDPTPLRSNLGGKVDAHASARPIARPCPPSAIWAVRARGALERRDDAGHKAGLAGVGAELAIGDLDQDGEPELIASLDTLNPLDDAVVARSWLRQIPGSTLGATGSLAAPSAP